MTEQKTEFPNNREVAIVWFRNDLRITDNPALYNATLENKRVIALYIWETEIVKFSPGEASCSWLHHSLLNLQTSLKNLQIPLIIRKGKPTEVLQELFSQTYPTTVYWNRRYEPQHIESDTQTENFLKKNQTAYFTYNSSLLLEPGEIANQNKNPYKVFTAFWKQHQKTYLHNSPLPAPKPQASFKCSIRSLNITNLELKPRIKWDKGFFQRFTPGETSAKKNLIHFSQNLLADYHNNRNFPSGDDTSKMSPHLHFGEISPRQIVNQIMFSPKQIVQHSEPFVRQIAWREFANHILYHFPHTVTRPLKPEFENFPWRTNSENFERWKSGQTGIPIIDAGMRELWATGWMHNRVRMIASSFLTKNLLIDWREGANWFWKTLVDADLANNTMGWQWVAGCGADAAPFFRIFNPILQSQKFDPQGIYIKKWIPELNQVPPKKIHTPWQFPAILEHTKYPEICCSLIESRATALHAYKSTKTNN